jgi:hypothetical protein
MARRVNATEAMRNVVVAVALVLLAACRGEPVPRDYQNNPPAMTHAPTTSSGTPSANGMPAGAPEPSSGAEGKTSGQPVNPLPAGATTTQNAPANTGTAVSTVQSTTTR